MQARSLFTTTFTHLGLASYLLLAAAAQQSPQSCSETPWLQLPTTDDHYQFNTFANGGENSWFAAREYCLAHSGDLTTVLSTNELIWITRHYPDSSNRHVLVGLRRKNASWSWLDVNNTVHDPTSLAWRAGEPLAGQDCAALSVLDSTLVSVLCDMTVPTTTARRFVCKISSKELSTSREENGQLNEAIQSVINAVLNSATTSTTSRP